MIDDCIGKYLSIAKRAHTMLLQKKLKSFDIGVAELLLLIALYKKDKRCQKELCNLYKLNKAAVGRALNKLEDNNFITKKIDENDKRKRIIYLTDKAQKNKQKFKKILKSTEDIVRQGLSDGEIKEFLKISKKIISNIHEKID